MNHRLLLSLSLSLALGLWGCGGDDSSEPTDDSTAGGEAVEPEVEVATGPVRSYVREGDTVTMRLDMVRVRESAVSSDIGSLIRSYPTWNDLLGRSGIDPIADFERVLVTSQGAGTDDATMVIVHNLTEAQVREAVLQMSVDEGAPPQWREVDGFDVVEWPAETETPRLVVIAGPHELVVTTEAELEAVVAVAHDHRLRREADEVVEPALELADDVIATVRASEISDRFRARIQHPPDSFEVELRDDPEEPERMNLSLRGAYPDAAAAEQARAWADEQRRFYAGQMLVRAVGLNRPLEEATIAVDGVNLTIDASFTEEEVQRVLGLLAFAQVGAGQ